MAPPHPFVAAHHARVATGASLPSSSSTPRIPLTPFLIAGAVGLGLVVLARGDGKTSGTFVGAQPVRRVYDVRGETMDDADIAEIAVRYPAWGKIIVEDQPPKERAHLRALIERYAASPWGQRAAAELREYEEHPEPLSTRG